VSRLRTRLDRIAADAGAIDRDVVVWRQAPDGLDAFTSPTAPGVVLTRGELRARPEAPGVTRVVVRRGSPGDRDAERCEDAVRAP
jgi:hypothetical protein